MSQLPNAKLFIHEDQALIDPSKLIAGATAVYGPDEMSKTMGKYSQSLKIGIVAEDGYQLALDGRIFKFWDTPGHARHHFCVLDHLTRSIFTGDSRIELSRI